MRSGVHLPTPVLRQARTAFFDRGELPGSTLDPRVVRSWQRSCGAGLTPHGRLSPADLLTGAALHRARAMSHDLVRHSLPVMEHLFEQVRDSQCMVILADSQGVLMHTLGDLDFLDKAGRVALASGACWDERQRGTNAIGTALAEVAAVEIHGAEHFLERNGFLTCAAAPIFAPGGELMGVLDISSEQRNHHPHTLGLVSTAAKLIENGLVLAAARQRLCLKLHPQIDGLDTVAQGLALLSDEGRIVGVNRKLANWLGLVPAQLMGMALSQLFDLDIHALLAQSHEGAKPHALRAADGRLFWGLVTAPISPRVFSKSGGRVLPAIDVTVIERDALAALDTGDAAWRRAADRARRVMDKPIPLLIQGESGSGKELFARAVHESSSRKAGPFVAINCGALPESLIESELFGYAPGAFSGACKTGSLGRIREAHQGTLFLDEIAEMPLGMQTRFLRVLQDHQVVPVGGGKPVRVEFNLIAATHQNLREAVEMGRFRTDLFYRINGLTVQLPALRARADFAALTDRLLRDLSPSRALGLAPEVAEALSAYGWPGNLRQYANVLTTAVALLDEGENQVDWVHLPDDLLDALSAGGGSAAVSPGGAECLADVSKQIILRALESARGNVSAAARQLGISRQTLYRKIRGKS